MGTAESSEQQAVASPGKTANFRRQLPRRANSQRFERNRVELSDDDAEMESDESQQWLQQRRKINGIWFIWLYWCKSNSYRLFMTWQEEVHEYY